MNTTEKINLIYACLQDLAEGLGEHNLPSTLRISINTLLVDYRNLLEREQLDKYLNGLKELNLR